MPTERLTFPGHSGALLSARLDLPDGPLLATALFAHCFTCSRDIPAAHRISQRLAAMGIAVLRFDFTGMGHAQGEFAHTTFTPNVGDLCAAAAVLGKRGMAPRLLIGHSLGGAAILRAAPDIASSRAVVTIGTPFDPGDLCQNFGGALDARGNKGHALIDLGGRALGVSDAYISDVAATRLEPIVAHLKKALLVLHAPCDKTVDISNAAQLFTAAKHPKSFVTLDDADHLISDPKDAEYAATVIAAWAGRYLELNHPAPPIGAPEGVVRVSEADADGFLQDVQSGPYHHALADEPLAYGGTNRGMSPYGFVAAGLGACTSMTIRMYARRKGWPLKNVRVEVSHDKVHAQDASPSTDTQIDLFRRRITLDGPLDAAQRQRLLEIADKCPVHRTLEAGARVETELL
ncbi:bifunctional alpha/beta hydrolase/OsmC family protein [Puniceibacterium sediminis]|uniref:Putative redox protein n=1 Tax=Puniceibacterium sediminis TaxID=1608407 RepID=A0A238UYU4_9RHOB|nr:bifunctional alpha/beta hydrolase/OsmC family protein [Puniceibacterium sediminis]SNR27186.1 putative redox protein [Puniceibacterium sediminis]